MNKLINQLKQGKFALKSRESGTGLMLETYTVGNSKLQISLNILGTWVYVNGVKQPRFLSWRIKRALQKGAMQQ